MKKKTLQNSTEILKKYKILILVYQYILNLSLFLSLFEQTTNLKDHDRETSKNIESRIMLDRITKRIALPFSTPSNTSSSSLILIFDSSSQV